MRILGSRLVFAVTVLQTFGGVYYRCMRIFKFIFETFWVNVSDTDCLAATVGTQIKSMKP